MSSLVHPHLLPRIVERNVATTLELNVVDSAGSQQTASAGTVTITDGSAVVVDAAAVTLGPPASYALLAATTADRGLTDAWLEVWTLTIGGMVYHFRRPGYLVRHAFYATIIDSDLTDRDSDLLSLLDPSDTTLEKYREQARQRIERDLLRKGRRPWLIFDSYDLCDAHIALSLAMVYRDLHLKLNDGRYADEAKARLEEYQTELAAVSFRYDSTESGVIDDDVPVPAEGPLVLSSAPRGGRRWYRGGY